MEEIKTVIKERMLERLKNIFSAIAICLSYDHDSYFVAGNSCNAVVPHDFDIYPWGKSFDFKGIKSRVESVGGYVIIETRNALTVNINGKVIQFCNYRKSNLVELIESFDFAHIQIGVTVDIEWRPGGENGPDDRGGYESSRVTCVEYTEDWVQAHLLETTWYTGSDYPLSSLLRTTKYFQRGAYAKKHEYKKDILNILNDIISRGYKDYQDYKDQLAAIDLLLLEPEEKEAAWNLFLTCGSHGLVKTFTANELEEEDDDD
jgi:hypothetical protein